MATLAADHAALVLVRDGANVIVQDKAHLRLLFVELSQKLPLDLSWRAGAEPRTSEQNRRLWWLHGLYASHLNRKLPDLIRAKLVPGVFRFTPEAIHEGVFKPHYLGARPGGHPRSSRELTVPEFAAVLDAYEADLRTEGVDFPELEQPW